MTLQFIETQKMARYVGNDQSKKLSSAELVEMLDSYKGEIKILPGIKHVHLPTNRVKEFENEFCGIVKLNRVKRWMNNGLFNRSENSRRNLIRAHLPFSRSKILRIACPNNSSMLTNREWRMIIDAMPLVEEKEKQLKAEMMRKFKGEMA